MMRVASRDLPTLFGIGAVGGLSDEQLLERFAARREEAAFEALVRRHGPMVWGICRRVLRDHHDAEDAFQATFLVLARKAASIAQRELLANWLYAVASKTAARAEAMASRRRARQRQVAEMPEPEPGTDERWDDLRPLLDRELGCLPEKYRIPIVLCDLQGKTHREAAEQLGWPIGTVSGRLSRARAMLAKRLVRRGVSLPVGTSALLLARGSASAGMPTSLVASTVEAVCLVTAGQTATAGLASTQVVILAEGVSKTMRLSKFKLVVATLFLGAAGAGAAGWSLAAAGAGSEQTPGGGGSADDKAEDPKGRADRPSPEQRYQALVERYESDHRALTEASEAAKAEEDIKALAPLQERLTPKVYAPGFLALADEYPGSEVAEDALIWLGAHAPFLTKEGDEALRRLTRDHARSAKLGPALAFQGRMPSFFESTGVLFRRVLAENTHREIRGLATYWLARHLLYKARCVRAARQRPDFGIIAGSDPYVEVLGAGWADRLRGLDPDAMEREADELLTRVARFYADVPHNDPKSRPGTLEEAAKSYLREIRELAVGQPAPEIEGADLDGRPFRLSDYRGQVVVLDFGSHFYCGACRQLYPRLRELTERHRRRPFAVVSINAEPEKDIEELKAAWSAEGNTWRCLFDGTWEGPIQEAWNIRRFPTIYLIDAEGRIRQKDLYGPDLEEAVDSLLKELAE